MIEEAYVSFETAKLLKEKGFDGDTSSCYILEDGTHHIMSDKIVQNEYYESQDSNEHGHLIQAPTLQMAMGWLREVHKLHIITIPYAPMDRHPYHHPGEADVVYIAQLFKGIIPIDEIGRSIIKLTHEEVCESALKYCLEKLI